MHKDQAAALFGRHWVLTCENDILEQIGRPDERSDFLALDEAIAATKTSEEKRLQADIHLRTAVLCSRRTRLTHWLAQRGWRKNSKKFLENYATYTQKLQKDRDLLAAWGDGTRQVDIVKRLPDELRCPVVLPLGTTLWAVHYCWPLDNNLRIVECEIIEHSIYHYVRHSNFDIELQYCIRAKGEDKTQVGTYYHEELGPEEINLQAGLVNYKMFISLEAAQTHALQVAQRAKDWAAHIDDVVARRVTVTTEEDGTEVEA